LGESARDDLVTVFVLPPSTRALEERLAKRAQDPPEVVARRMAEAASEMSHYPEYDYVIVNDDLEVSVSRVQSILAAERCKRDRLVGLAAFVHGLQAGY
jgi:guanylate kinase